MDRDTIQRQREIEDAALELGEERAEIRKRLTANTKAITELLRTAVHHVPLERFSKLVGVGRATLYRWLSDGASSRRDQRTTDRRGK